jgi:hypothetical protein
MLIYNTYFYKWVNLFHIVEATNIQVFTHSWDFPILNLPHYSSLNGRT